MLKIQIKISGLFLYSFLIFSSSILSQAPAQPTETYFKRTAFLSDNPKADSLDLAIDSIIRTYMENSENAGLSIGITKGNRTSFYNYGETLRDSGKLPGKTTVYETGALTTTFCGLLFAKAIIEKKINPDADIRTYLSGEYPDLQFQKTPVLVRHLANHTSGFVAFPEDLQIRRSGDSLSPYVKYSKEKLLTYLRTTHLLTVPGSTYDYSNLGIAVLGLLLEKVYAKPFDELVREKICVPLGMKNTAIHLTSEQVIRFANGYKDNGQQALPWNLDGFEAAGAIKSTSEDLLIYLKALQEDNAAAKLVQKVTYAGRPKVGITWFLSKTNKGNTLVSQSGGTFGFGAFIGFVKAGDCSVVVLVNTCRNVDFIALAILNYLQQ